MNLSIVLDENVSLRVAGHLRSLGHNVLAVAERPDRGSQDEAIFALAAKGPSLLITRDHHFKNPIRFPSSKLHGILFLMDGNLSAADEVALIDSFLKSHPADSYAGKFVFLSPQTIRIR